MSIARNNRKKARRRELDAQNPDRARIRRMIRRGIIPRWFIGKINGSQLYKTGQYTFTWDEAGGILGNIKRSRTVFIRWPLLKSTFDALTRQVAA